MTMTATNLKPNANVKAVPTTKKVTKANAKQFAKPNKPVNNPEAEAFSAQAQTLINDAVKAFDKAGKKGMELVRAWLDAGMYTQQISDLCKGNTKAVNALIKGTKLEDVSRQDRNDAAYLFANESVLMDGLKAGTIKAGGANYMRKQLKKLLEPVAEDKPESESDDGQSDTTEAKADGHTAESLAAYVVEQIAKNSITLVDFENALMDAIK